MRPRTQGAHARCQPQDKHSAQDGGPNRRAEAHRVPMGMAKRPRHAKPLGRLAQGVRREPCAAAICFQEGLIVFSLPSAASLSCSKSFSVSILKNKMPIRLGALLPITLLAGQLDRYNGRHPRLLVSLFGSPREQSSAGSAPPFARSARRAPCTLIEPCSAEGWVCDTARADGQEGAR